MSNSPWPCFPRLYNLCARIHALDSLKAAFRAYIKKAGLALILDEEKDKDMVRLLLDMKAALDEVLTQAFQRSETFGHALKDAFEHFINQRANRWASSHAWRWGAYLLSFKSAKFLGSGEAAKQEGYGSLIGESVCVCVSLVWVLPANLVWHAACLCANLRLPTGLL